MLRYGKRIVHRVPQVKDVYKSEVAFTLVPSNLGKKGRTCSYSARLSHNQVLDEETVVSQMCAEFDPAKNKVEVVVSPRYELKDAAAYLKPVNETKTSRPELTAITYDGVTLGTIAVGKVCHLNGTEFIEDGKRMVDAVWLEDASGKTVAEATIIKYDAGRMDLRFDGEIAPGPYRIVLRRMNADGKSYALARLKVEVVG